MDEKGPLVSVGIPTYNRPEGLRRTLECMTGQTYRNLEIIVADNCSPGTATQEVVRSFQEKDPRITYYRHEKNFGMDYNGRFVLKKATGDFFLSAADDDEWFPAFIEKCLAPLLQDSSILVCTSNVILVSDTILSQMKENRSDPQQDLQNPALSPYWLLTQSFHTHGLPPLQRVKKVILNSGQNGGYGIYRTAELKKWYFDPSYHSEKFGSDRSFVARMNLFGSIYQVPEYLFVYHHGMGASCVNPAGMKNRISVWQYYGLKIYPLLTAYINMITDSLSWPVSIPDHIRIVGYYLRRMVTAKVRRYTAKTPFTGVPFPDYQPPKYE